MIHFVFALVRHHLVDHAVELLLQLAQVLALRFERPLDQVHEQFEKRLLLRLALLIFAHTYRQLSLINWLAAPQNKLLHLIINLFICCDDLYIIDVLSKEANYSSLLDELALHFVRVQIKLALRVLLHWVFE